MPPSPTPPNARILTDRELAALPAGLRPPGAAWGVEFHRRRWGAVLKSLVLALLHSLPLLVAARLALHYRGAGPGWLYVLGGLSSIFCLLGLIAQLKALAVGLTWRSRLIFSPGHLLWQRRSVLKVESRVFDLADLTGLAVVRQVGGPRGEKTGEQSSPGSAEPFEHHRSRVEAGSLRDSALNLRYRRADGSEAVATLLQAPGRGAACFWAADRILDALAPRTVPFTES